MNLTANNQLHTVNYSDTTGRDHSIDTLRTGAAFLVIILHISATYVVKGISSKTFDENFWASNIIDSFSRICVPLFVLVSGRFLLGKSSSFHKFYTKRAKRIFLPLIVWSIIYSVYQFIGYYIIKGEIDLNSLVTNIIQGRPFYHLWYLYMLLGLYLVTPMINYFITQFDNKTILKTTVLLLFLGFFINLYDYLVGNDPFFLLWFIPYVGYFLLGYILKNSKEIPIIFLFGLYIVSSISIAVLSYYTAIHNGTLYFYEYLSPLVIIGAICIYKIFCQITIRKNFLSRISNLSFGIYLTHAGILHIINMALKIKKTQIHSNLLIEMFVLFISVLAISISISYLLSKSKFLKKIV